MSKATSPEPKYPGDTINNAHYQVVRSMKGSTVLWVRDHLRADKHLLLECGISVTACSNVDSGSHPRFVPESDFWKDPQVLSYALKFEMQMRQRTRSPLIEAESSTSKGHSQGAWWSPTALNMPQLLHGAT